MKKRAYIPEIPLEPEYFEPGTLVILDPILWNVSAPGTLGLIVDLSSKPVNDGVCGGQYVHTVLVGEKLYKALRSSFIGAYNG
jgi:hypothetical protein